MKYGPQKVCNSCNNDLGVSENIVSSLTVQKQPDHNSLSIQISLESKVHDSITIPIETDINKNTQIIGLLRVEAKNKDLWYEDAWTVKGYSGSYLITQGIAEKNFEWPTETKLNSMGSEYKNSVGHPFDAEELVITFEFVEPSIGMLTTTIDAPDFLIDL